MNGRSRRARASVGDLLAQDRSCTQDAYQYVGLVVDHTGSGHACTGLTGRPETGIIRTLVGSPASAAGRLGSWKQRPSRTRSRAR